MSKLTDKVHALAVLAVKTGDPIKCIDLVISIVTDIQALEEQGEFAAAGVRGLEQRQAAAIEVAKREAYEQCRKDLEFGLATLGIPAKKEEGK